MGKMSLACLVFTITHPAGLAAIMWGAPLLLWGLLALSVPVIIHLVLRERPRRQVFPALRFLLQSHASASRTQRLRHFLLLLCRFALIALVVGLLAKPGCTNNSAGPHRATLPGAASPASAVIVIDDSASMGYRCQGRSRFDTAIEWAINLVEDTHHFGPASQFAVITGSTPASAAYWSSDIGTVRRQLDSLRVASHSEPVAELLRRAYTLLPAARHDRREVYLFTDLAEHAWRKEPPPAPAMLNSIYVMDCGQAEDRNIVLTLPAVPTRVIPANVPTYMPARIRTGDLAAEPAIELNIDGSVRSRQSASLIAPHREVEIALALPGLSTGPHAVTVALQGGDALDADNRRFATLAAGELPTIGLITDRSDNATASLLEAMIAPPALPPGEQTYHVVRVPVDRLLDADLAGFRAVLLADVEGVGGLGWDHLGKYAKAGGTVIVVPGPALKPDGYHDGLNILPAPIESVGDIADGGRPAAAEFTHPFLKPFADAGVDSINDRLAFRRLILGPLQPQARVIVPFADRHPALLERTVGTGRVILLAFGLTPEWGQFGTQAGPTIVLLHTMLESVAPPARTIAAFLAGAPATLARADAAGPLQITANGQDPTPLTISSAGSPRLPTEQPGVYTIQTLSTDATVLCYSVNVDPDESEPARIPGSDVNSMINSDLVEIVLPNQSLRAAAEGQSGVIHWTIPLGLGLLGLLVLESLFANRFYSTPPPAAPQA